MAYNQSTDAENLGSTQSDGMETVSAVPDVDEEAGAGDLEYSARSRSSATQAQDLTTITTTTRTRRIQALKLLRTTLTPTNRLPSLRKRPGIRSPASARRIEKRAKVPESPQKSAHPPIPRPLLARKSASAAA